MKIKDAVRHNRRTGITAGAVVQHTLPGRKVLRKSVIVFSGVNQSSKLNKPFYILKFV